MDGRTVVGVGRQKPVHLLPRVPALDVHRPVGMSPEACTWPFLPPNIIDQSAFLRVVDVTNRVNMTLTPIRSALDLGWSSSTRRVTFRCRPGRAGARLGS